MGLKQLISACAIIEMTDNNCNKYSTENMCSSTRLTCYRISLCYNGSDKPLAQAFSMHDKRSFARSSFSKDTLAFFLEDNRCTLVIKVPTARGEGKFSCIINVTNVAP